jgi:hypothetical protein
MSLFFFRKYIRDLDRTYLSQKAFAYCLETIEMAIEEKKNGSWVEEKDKMAEKVVEKAEVHVPRHIKLLLGVHKAWQFGNKHAKETDRLSKLFQEAYLSFSGENVC